MSERLSKLAAILIALTAGQMVMPAHARPWNFTFKPAIDCEPRDRACILDEAIEAQIRDFENREYKPNIDPHAQTAADLYQLVPEPEKDALTERWLAAGADEEFFVSAMSYTREAAPPPRGITATDLREVLETRTTPDGGDFDSYLQKAFPVVLAEDPKGGIALWEEYRSILHRDAFRGFSIVLDWASQYDIDALERFTAHYLVPKTAFYDGWDRISQMAAHHCDAGDVASGARLLAILETEKGDWTIDQELQAIQWSKMTTGVLHCRGEEAAMAMLDPLFDRMQADIEQVQRNYPEQNEQKFNIGVIRSEVAESAVQVIALWLHEQGRTEEGRQLFARLPSMAMTATVDSIANEGILGSEFEDNSFEDMIEFNESAAMYDDDPLVALRWYVEDFKPAFDTCCRDKDYARSSLDLIEKAWPADVAKDAAELTFGYLKRLETIDPQFNGPDQYDEAMLRVAALARASDGCDLTDEDLSQLLARIPYYASDYSKGTVLRAYLRFLDTEPGDDNGGCSTMLPVSAS